MEVSTRRPHSVLVMLLIIAVSGPVLAQVEPRESPKIARFLQKGQSALQEGHYEKALKSFRRADQLSGNTSVDAIFGIAEVHLRSHAYRLAFEQAERITEIAATTEIKIRAYRLMNGALLMRNQEIVDRLGGLTEFNAEEHRRNLDRAEVILRKILELSDGNALSSRFYLAQVLYDLGRPLEALDMLRKYLSSVENGRERGAAEDLLVCLETINLITPPQQIGGSVEPPRKIYSPGPQYTEKARRAKIQGVVIVQSVIDKQGNVVCTKALKGLPLGLTLQALQTIRRWRFEPAKLQGDPVEVYYNLTINFRLASSN